MSVTFTYSATILDLCRISRSLPDREGIKFEYIPDREFISSGDLHLHAGTNDSVVSTEGIFYRIGVVVDS